MLFFVLFLGKFLIFDLIRLDFSFVIFPIGISPKLSVRKFSENLISSSLLSRISTFSPIYNSIHLDIGVDCRLFSGGVVEPTELYFTSTD